MVLDDRLTTSDDTQIVRLRYLRSQQRCDRTSAFALPECTARRSISEVVSLFETQGFSDSNKPVITQPVQLLTGLGDLGSGQLCRHFCIVKHQIIAIYMAAQRMQQRRL